jgi:hypothetical protein
MHWLCRERDHRCAELKPGFDTNRTHVVHVQFLRRHVRMADVRQYLADALAMYGSLVDFKPAPGNASTCYSGPALLAQFGFPYEADRQLIATTYPWLADFTQPGCPPPPAAAAPAPSLAAGTGGGRNTTISANQTRVRV